MTADLTSRPPTPATCRTTGAVISSRVRRKLENGRRRCCEQSRDLALWRTGLHWRGGRRSGPASIDASWLRRCTYADLGEPTAERGSSVPAPGQQHGGAMAVRKGQLTPAQIDREWPRQVEIAVPPHGLGSRLNELHSSAAELEPGYRARSRTDGASHFIRFCFRSTGAAEVFRDRCGGSLV